MAHEKFVGIAGSGSARFIGPLSTGKANTAKWLHLILLAIVILAVFLVMPEFFSQASRLLGTLFGPWLLLLLIIAAALPARRRRG